MTPARLNSLFCSLWLRAFLPRFSGSVSQWCEENVEFREPGKKGRFSFYGREYLREPLDNYGLDAITDQIVCFGTRTGKTTLMFAGQAFRLWQKARRALNVHPASKGAAGAESIAKTRFIPMLRASPGYRDLMPSGGPGRFDITRSQQIFRNGSIADWVGSNSVGQLASNSMEDVYLDEVDKFNVTRRRNEDGREVEADACQLADERAVEYRFPKRIKSSTPTLETGKIWTELLKTDLRRRFIPCPLCGRDNPSSRLVVLVWSDTFTVLPRKFGYGTPREPGSDIPLAHVEWDKEAKRQDGSFDLERVEKSAGYLCPHCGSRFRDDDKIWCDQNGVWIPTQLGPKSSAGYHLPSMYASHDQTTAGKMAIEFLEAVRSIEGPRNFINSRLAEPFVMQHVSANRVGSAAQTIEITGEWLKIMTVDYQQNAPYFWAMVRAWNGADKSHGLAYRSFNQWSDIDDLQEEFQIIPEAIGIDVGFQQGEVLTNCATNRPLPEWLLKWAEMQNAMAAANGVFIPPGVFGSRGYLLPAKQEGKPQFIGWTPIKSFGGKRWFRDQETGLHLPYRSKADQDPFAGTEMAKQVCIELLEFLLDEFEDWLENIRSGKTGLLWTISPEVDTKEYHNHMAGVTKEPITGKWKKRDSRWPDHLNKCEVMNLVMAFRLQLISLKAIQTKQETTQPK